MRHKDAHLIHAAEPLVNIAAHGLDHNLPPELFTSRLGEGVQLFPLNLENRPDFEHGGNGRRSRCDPSAFFQIFQGVQHDIDGGVEPGLLQKAGDFSRRTAGSGQGEGIQHRLPLGYRNTLIVDHADPAVIILRQGERRRAGAGQAAGHRNMHQLVILPQHTVPEGEQIADQRL